MQTAGSHGGDLSQDSHGGLPHRSLVIAAVSSADSPAPAARHGRRFYNSLSASSVGLELGLSVVIALLFGMWLDGKLGTTPWLMLVWLGLGLVAGFRGVLRAVRRADRAADAEEGVPHG